MSPPRVLLINPWIYDFAAFDLWAKPLGLLYIGESLRRKRVEVAIIDCVGASDGRKYGTGRFRKQEVPKPKALQSIPRRYSRYGISEEAFLDQLGSLPRPDAVLVTAMMTYWYPGAFRVIELVAREVAQNSDHPGRNLRHAVPRPRCQVLRSRSRPPRQSVQRPVPAAGPAHAAGSRRRTRTRSWTAGPRSIFWPSPATAS